jgi:hypothetical protein
VSTDVSTSPSSFDWNPEESPLRLFCPELDEIERQLLQSFDECDVWRLALEEEQAALVSERAAIETEQQTFRKQQAEFAVQQKEFLLQSEQTNAPPSTDSEALASLEEKLLLAEQEIELLREQSQLQAAWVEQHKQERLQHEELYAVLELELEHVRNRAGELSDNLACSRSEWDLEKSHWEQERKELQSLLAQQQARIKDCPGNHEPQITDMPTTAQSLEFGSEPGGKKEDAVVVGSVLAQFERIRNERAIRRRKAAEGG